MDKTSLFKAEEFREVLFNEIILYELKEISLALEEKGYDPVTQIVGYLLTDDDGYITSHNNARNLINKYNKSDLLSVIVKGSLSK
ncbi:MAG: IreB family regulatory phosphoprotein [bacterium]